MATRPERGLEFWGQFLSLCSLLRFPPRFLPASRPSGCYFVILIFCSLYLCEGYAPWTIWLWYIYWMHGTSSPESSRQILSHIQHQIPLDCLINGYPHWDRGGTRGTADPHPTHCPHHHGRGYHMRQHNIILQRYRGIQELWRGGMEDFLSLGGRSLTSIYHMTCQGILG